VVSRFLKKVVTSGCEKAILAFMPKRGGSKHRLFFAMPLDLSLLGTMVLETLKNG